MKLIIATSNQGKLKEIRRILEGINIPMVSLNELDKKFRIVENRKTFLDNAIKKALPVSAFYLDDYVVAEDSGLCVDYLNNSPGIYSKRYSGKNATDLKNNLKLLKELKAIPVKKRIAYYSCSLVLFKGGELIKSFEGKLKGIIDCKMAGENGFGYDPVFYLSKYNKTVAQLPIEIKNNISHRAKAFKKLMKYLLVYKSKFCSKKSVC